jgi:phosphatidylglycerol:prolipoprotein diacylglycerol transferase
MFAIAFPAIDPVLIDVGPFAVRWYGLAYVAGLMLGALYARSLVREERHWSGPSPLGAQDLSDALVWAAIGVVVGGRLGHVLIYDPGHYLANPWEILQVWRGGMAFHGGLVGCAAALMCFAYRRHTPIASLFDVAAAAAPIGLGLGRLANLVNGELWGRVTEVPWAMVFPDGGPLPRHPSQIYEGALEGLLLLGLLNWAVRRGALRRPGLVAGLFGIGYGCARIAAEFFREPDPQLEALAGGATMGMALSLPLVAFGAVIACSTVLRRARATA